VGGKVESWEAGVDRARQVLASGAGLTKLEALRGFGRDAG